MKLFVVTKKAVLLYICLGIFVFGVLTLNWSKTVSVFENSVKRDLPIYCVDKQDKVCSISFDAAWGADDTQTLIKIMEDYGVKTTFFVVGDWVDRFPEQVKALSDSGHEIMNHSDTHPHMTQLSVQKMQQEVRNCNEKIKAITGTEPNLFRPPYGDYNNDVVGAMRDIGMYTIQWSVERMDIKRNV